MKNAPMKTAQTKDLVYHINLIPGDDERSTSSVEQETSVRSGKRTRLSESMLDDADTWRFRIDIPEELKAGSRFTKSNLRLDKQCFLPESKGFKKSGNPLCSNL